MIDIGIMTILFVVKKNWDKVDWRENRMLEAMQNIGYREGHCYLFHEHTKDNCRKPNKEEKMRGGWGGENVQ